MSFLVDDNEFGDNLDENGDRQKGTKIPILISHIGDKNNPNKCLFKRKENITNEDLCSGFPDLDREERDKVSPLAKLSNFQELKQFSSTTKNKNAPQLNKNILMKNLFSEISRKKPIRSPVLQRDKLDSKVDRTNEEFGQVSFVMQPSSGMKSIAKLWSKFKNSITDRELSHVSRLNYDKVSNVYANVPDNNISAFGMEHLKREKEDFIRRRYK